MADWNKGDPKASWRYTKDFPEDTSKISKALHLLETYSKIPPEEINDHVTAVREKAFGIFPYPCIGRWRFLDLYLTETPDYPVILDRLKAGEALLDVGTCFGHILRQLAADGAPAANLAGTDLRPEFIELGYDLFRDRDTFPARFVAGDILDPAPDPALAALDGRFDILHTAAFFHLFNWEDQVRIGERIVRFFRPGADALVVGRQVGEFEPPSLEQARADGNRRYLHNFETLQRLWDVIGEKTGTRWKVGGEIFESEFDSIHRVLIRFAVRKVS